ncbi:MAG: DUF6089 family protein [Flavobacteriales bacterium]|nr:DUF6089 family protein [Flavobacteriales bacterium]
MRRRHLIFLLVILLVNNLFYSQSTDSSAVILNIKDTIISTGKSKSLINPRDLELKQKSYWEALSDKNKNSETDEYEESLYKPMISFGVGTLSFFGDVGDTLPGKKNIKRSPFQGGFSYTVRLINPINDFLDVAFYAMFGSTGVNQSTPSSLLPAGNNGLGFKSTIKSGGITFNYNFNQFLKKGHIVEPYIHVGIESIEYNSELDTNRIDNIDFDSDVTVLSNDQPLNKYALGIPVEIGAHLHIGNKIKFRVGTAMHFTSTDYMDGINNSKKFPFGTGKDNLLFTHIAIAYDFNSEPKDPPADPFMDEISMNLLLQDTIDSDGDSIVDHIDLCAKTPPNTQVDQFGCPVDDDLDGVPNSFDDELLTYEGVITNEKGITMTDDDFFLAYKIYKDSTGEFSEYDTIFSTSHKGYMMPNITRVNKPKVEKKKPKKGLFIVIGSDVQGVTAEDLWEKLADRDFQVKESGDSIMYVLGGYDEQELSEKIKELEDNNVDVQGVVEITENQEITTLEEERIEQIVNSPKEPSRSENTTSIENMVPVIIPDDNVPTFRVQIGAFNRKIKKSVFRGISNVVGIKGDDGLYRFFSGSYTDKDKAATHKVDLSLSGYNDAFLVAFQNGKRITLKEAGFEVSENYKENLEISSEVSENPIDPEMVKFRIQVGAFKEKVPEDILANFKRLGSVMAVTSQGYTKYYMGDFKEYKNILKFRSKLADNGLEDCFIVGEFQNNIITSKEALNLLGQ